MSMKALSTPRRVYIRNGQALVTYGGLYFGSPKNKESQISTAKPVRIEVQPRAGGKARIAVTQGKVTENWTEQHLVFASRS